MRKRKTNPNLIIFLLWLELIIMPGCSFRCHSHSSGPSIYNYKPDFYPTGDISSILNSSCIYLNEIKSEQGRITLGINTNNIDEINVIYLDLVYNSAIINYSDSREGNFFNSDGKSTSGFKVALENDKEGRLYISINRLNNSSIKGSGLIGEISFVPIAADTSFVNFENNKLYRYNSDTLESTEVKAIWFSGTIINTRL